MQIRARHYATGEKIDLTIDAGRITRQEPARAASIDREAGWVAPALFDLQINGCKGHSFNSPHLTVDHVREIIDVCRAHGIGGLLPTLITHSFEAIQHGFATLKRAREIDPTIASAVPGYHLEGPYISSEDGPRGAHPLEYVAHPTGMSFFAGKKPRED